MNANWMPGVAALMGVALAGASSVEARDIFERGGRSRDSRYEAYSGRIGFDKGYEDGLKHGRHDGDDRENYEPTHDRKFRQGDHGYKSSYGSRYEYVRSYRQGYLQGYRDGYEAYASASGHRGGSRGRYGSRDGGYYGRNDGDYSQDGGYYGRNGGSYAQYPFDAYDYQRDGRHRHEGRSGWCTIDHRYDDRGRIHEIPRR